ncbi:MAG: bacteriophage abortive infection AbiH family protein [Campylobacterales bacterium]|nr:bacteriophage abortive infection AbiH family protein [Campylobacterales bacterium]
MKNRDTKILYVIGNGFDRWHKLPTTYTDFYVYSESLLDELGQYLSSDVSSENPWSDFETYLGTFDGEKFYNNHNHTDSWEEESFRPSMAFSLEDGLNAEAENLVDAIRSQFQEWIESISVDDAEKKFCFEPKARFISFNYTSLLQTLYGIEDKRIFHIHGSASKYDELIFGHGESREVEPELDEDGNSNRIIFSDAKGAAAYPFYAFQKPVSDILERNQSYFESLKNVEVVVVLGHSLNDIDLPYFKKISEITQGSKWIVSFYKEDERIKHIKQFGKCGMDSNQIVVCFIDDIPKILSSMQLS